MTGARHRVWPLLCLALVPYAVGLGSPPLWDANEPLYAQPPAEVLHWAKGDFLAPTWNGKPYFAHAPWSTWATVPFYAVFGVNEFAARLPLAIAAVLTVLATYVLGRRLVGAGAGLMAALVLAATPRYWLFARQLAGDVWLVAFLTGAFALAVPAVSGTGDPATRRRDLRWAHGLVGIGTLAKGPVIWVLYFGALGVSWWAARRPVPLRSLRPVRAIALVVALGAPWSVYMAMRYPQFLEQHYGWYHGARLIGGIGTRGLLYYPVVLLGDAQPWLLSVPAALRHARALPTRFAAWFPWCGIGVVVVLFSLSAGKRAVYLLPVYPLLAVGVAPWLSTLIQASRRSVVVVVGVAGAGAALVTGGLLVRVLDSAPDLSPELWGVVAVLGLGAVALAMCAWRGLGLHVVALVLALTLTLQVAVGASFPALARYRPIPGFARTIRQHQNPGHPEAALLYAVPVHSLNFYLGRATAVERTPSSLQSHVQRAGAAFVVTDARFVDTPVAGGRRVRTRHLPTHAPSLVLEELARAPVLAFRFHRTILGEGPSTRDYVLLRVMSR